MKKEQEKTTISVIIPIETRNKLNKIAKEEERNLSWIVRKAIQDYLDKKEN